MTLPLLFAAAAAALQPVPSGSPGRPFMSPMGEPVMGASGGVDGLTVWFGRADRNHDGSITADEMAADATRFFDTLNVNHDGEIDPEEVAHYEQVIEPELTTGFLETTASSDSLGGRRAHRARHHLFGEADGGGDDEAEAGRYGLLQIPEPVTSADTDFDRGISAAEFQNAALQRFNQLDVGHSGRLSLRQLESIRRAVASEWRRPPPDKSSPDAAPGPDAEGDTETPY